MSSCLFYKSDITISMLALSVHPIREQCAFLPCHSSCSSSHQIRCGAWPCRDWECYKGEMRVPQLIYSRQHSTHPLAHIFKRECFFSFLFSLSISFNLSLFVLCFVILQQECANRLSILSSGYLQQLVKLLHTHSLAKDSALQVQSTLLVLSII